MKTKKTIMQKLILSIICIMLIVNFTIPNYSQAVDVSNLLYGPIKGLVCAIGDTVMYLIQLCFIGSDKVIEQVPSGNAERWGHTLWGGENEIEWPTFKITPEEIFKGKVPSLNVNFLRPIEEYDNLSSEEQGMTKEKTQDALISLRNTISSWYMALRNISIIGLLSVLVYVGIRMMLCSVASEKAKYKQMLMDWVVALCLIFFLHYIMSFTMTVVEQITKIFSNSGTTQIGLMSVDQGINGGVVNNLMEYARVYVSLADSMQSMTYLIIYIWLIVYTVKFIFTYIKRFIHMAFLTMIAPLVALTYPLDKISDGKAQAFDMWLKDYIFNALIQPFHLIIYTVFVSSAMQLAVTNMIYACVAIGFISQAEKFMRKMFGFDKAPNAPGGLGAFAGGALAGNLLNRATSAIGKGGNGGKEKSGNDAPKPPKTQTDASGYEKPGLEAGGNENQSRGTDGNEGDSASNFESSSESQGDAGALPEGQTGNEDLSSPEMQEQLDQGEDGEGADGIDSADSDAPQLDSGGETSEGSNPNLASSQNSSSEKKKIGGFKNLAKGVWTAGKPIAGKIARTGLKVGGGALGAAVGGLAALATGGDISKGIMSGAGVGAGLGSAAGNLPSAIGSAGRGVKNAVTNTRANFISAYDKDRADEMQYRNNFLNDKAKQDYVRKYFKNSDGGALSGKELKAKMEQVYEYERAGITDIDSQKELMDMEDKKIQEGYSEENARQQVLYANEMASKMDKKQLMEKSELLKNDHMAKLMDQGYTEQQAKTVTDKTFDDIYAIKGISASGMRQNEQKRAQQKAADAQAAAQKEQKAAEREKLEMENLKLQNEFYKKDLGK